MYDLQECVEKLDGYLETLLPNINGEIDIDMSEDKTSYYWNFDFEGRSYTLTITKDCGGITAESWREGTKAQYKKH